MQPYYSNYTNVTSRAFVIESTTIAFEKLFEDDDRYMMYRKIQ